MIGALENLAPTAHQFHLVKAPDEWKKLPRVGKNWNGEKTLFFEPEQRFIAPGRGTFRVELEDRSFTTAILFKIPKGAGGTMFRISVKELDAERGFRLAQLNFWGGNLSLQSDGVKERALLKLETDRYRIAFLAFDGAKNELRIWERGPRGNLTLNPGDKPIKTKVSGEFKMASYEFGHLNRVARENFRKRIEIPAMCMYDGLLSDKEKHEVALALYRGTFPESAE